MDNKVLYIPAYERYGVYVEGPTFGEKHDAEMYLFKRDTDAAEAGLQKDSKQWVKVVTAEYERFG